MRASTKRGAAVAMGIALAGCGLVADFGNKPELGVIGPVDGGGTGPTLDATPGPDAPSTVASDDGGPEAAPIGDAAPDAACPANLTACGSSCVNLTSDPAHCGACGRACGASFACTASVCDDAVVTLSAGSHHACASLAGGALYCWGLDDVGQVGNGDAGGPVTSPTLIPRDDQQATVANASQLALGAVHSCGLFPGGQMRCWGSEFYGQLCNGEFSGVQQDGGLVFTAVPDDAYQASSVQFAQFYVYTSIAAGSSANHGCATTTAGVVVCWGEDDEGQLGVDGGVNGSEPQGCGASGDTTCYPHPAAVAGVPDVQQLAVGQEYTCALDSKGVIQCWGLPGHGQLGTGTTPFGLPHPPAPTLLDAGATWVAAGIDSTCAVLADGSVWCWGYNVAGQLGHDGGADAGDNNCCLMSFCGFEACTGTPSKVHGLGPASRVAVGCSHACALETDGTVWCWGANDKGQLGTGDNVGAGYPRQVSGLTGAAGITLGCDTSCAWKTDGTAWCWGLDGDGELGNGTTTTNASVPTKVPLP